MIAVPILSRSIPHGGRRLTSAEQRRLRLIGVSCSNATSVWRNGSEWVGSLYTPLTNRSRSLFGPLVREA
jgi:hypothetical protein